MSHTIVDRRKNDKGKSSSNRKKFIDRVRGILKDGVKDIVRDGGLKDLASSKGKKVRVPIRNLDEPHFHHDGTGVNDLVRPGNDRFKTGDRIKRPPNGQSPGGASEDGEGEDSFTFHLTKEEFLDLFFENCALPDLVKENMAVMTEEVIQRSGFTTDGSPAQMNIMRSMRGAKARRSGLRAMKNKKLKELEEKEQQLVAEISARKLANQETTIEEDALERVRHDLEVIRRRLKAIPFLDPVDLRFNHWSKTEIPKMQAAMICLMDVSGSMYEQKKELAKTFYLLLYLFLERQYEHIEIEYITYHSTAQVVDEQTFYYGHETGGTVTSKGIDLAYETIMEKYNPSLWNIYVAHTSDGDNWSNDNQLVIDTLTNRLLPIVQYYAYVQVNTEYEARFSTEEDGNNLWSVFKPLSDTRPNVSAELITDHEDVYPVFIKLFERKK